MDFPADAVKLHNSLNVHHALRNCLLSLVKSLIPELMFPRLACFVEPSGFVFRHRRFGEDWGFTAVNAAHGLRNGCEVSRRTV